MSGNIYKLADQKKKLRSDDAVSALRSAMARLKQVVKDAGKMANIVIIKSTIDHDASGIMETLIAVDVSFKTPFTLY